MPRDLFQGLRPVRSRTAGWRSLPASLVLHALAAGAVAALVVRPVASALDDRRSGVLQLPSFPAAPAGAARSAAGRRATKPRHVADAIASAPVASIPIEDGIPDPSSGLDDSPAPCLTHCGDAATDSAGDGDPTGTGSGLGVGTGTGMGPLPIGGNLRPPRKTLQVLPQYPELARRAGVGGIVIVQCVIDVDGRVADARVLRGHPLLDAAALEAVRQWRYEATRLNGIAVPVVMTVTVTFQTPR